MFVFLTKVFVIIISVVIQNSAILVYIVKLKVKDKGEIHNRLRSSLIVFSKESGEWVIISDVVGQDPVN